MKPMKTQRLLGAMIRSGCMQVRSNGRHTVFRCPCGEHVAPVPTSHRDVAAGVVRSIESQFACLPKGWLQ